MFWLVKYMRKKTQEMSNDTYAPLAPSVETLFLYKGD